VFEDDVHLRRGTSELASDAAFPDSSAAAIAVEGYSLVGAALTTPTGTLKSNQNWIHSLNKICFSF
jgi:hypothetical protein